MQITITFEFDEAPNGDLLLIRVEQNHDYIERFEIARLDRDNALSIKKQLDELLG